MADKLQLVINKPIGIKLTELAVTPTKEYGPGVTAKGVLSDGTEVDGFIPGKVWAVLRSFKEGGIIDAKDAYDEEPTQRYTIRVLKPLVTLERRKLPGMKFAEIVVAAQNGVDQLASQPVAEEEANTLAQKLAPSEDGRAIDPLGRATRFMSLYSEILDAGIKLHKSVKDAGEFTSDTAYKITYTVLKGS